MIRDNKNGDNGSDDTSDNPKDGKILYPGQQNNFWGVL